MSWSDSDVATPAPAPSWSDADVVVAPTLPKAKKKWFDGPGPLTKTAIAAARSSLDLGIMLNEKLGIPTRENPIKSQGEGYDLAGDVVLSAVPGAAAGKYATKLPLLGKALAGPGFWKSVARSSVAGGAGGAAGAAVLGEDISDAATMGAVGGPVLAGMGNAGSKIVTGTKRLFESAQNRSSGEVRRIFGDRTDEVIAALRGIKTNVPGERVTAGSAASTRFPELKVLEQSARGRPGANQYLQLDAENEAARLAAIEKYAAPGRRGIAPGIGAPVPPSTLERVRYRKTDPLYEEAFKDRIPFSKNIKQAITGAEVLPANLRGAKSFDQQRANIMAQGGSVPGGATVSKSTVSIKQLQSVKEQMSKEIDSLERATDAAGIAKKQRLISARESLTAEMKKASPRYAKANDTYAKLMIPENQSAVAKQLVTALRNPSGAERVPAFLSAMQNAPATIKRAGAPRYKQIEQIASPEQLRAYKGVQSSLERQAAYDALPTKPGMIPEYLSPQERAVNLAPKFFDQTVTTIKSAVKHLGRRSDAEVNKIIGDAMMDPNKMADLLSQVPPSQRSAVAKAFSSLANPASIGAVAGGTSSGGNE